MHVVPGAGLVQGTDNILSSLDGWVDHVLLGVLTINNGQRGGHVDDERLPQI